MHGCWFVLARAIQMWVRIARVELEDCWENLSGNCRHGYAGGLDLGRQQRKDVGQLPFDNNLAYIGYITPSSNELEAAQRLLLYRTNSPGF